jgi:acyl-CoA synthetase (AMP-forming)/AMP-acid ligase II/thioesterase domain-containing protein/acyl carrier protein
MNFPEGPPGADDPKPEEQLRSLFEIIACLAREMPGAGAIAAPGAESLSYGQLFRQLEDVHETLRAAGLEKNDRVAVVLPNGPEMAVALLGVMASAACAPLNPDYTSKEFDFFFSDIKAQALLTQAGMNSEALGAARLLGLPVLFLSPSPSEASGRFKLAAGRPSPRARSAYCGPQDLALLLHTSGTTARPKLVPLTQINVCFSAATIASFLGLTRTDRYLNVMPLFHVHGMIGGLLSSILAGACVFCPPGFHSAHFIDWWDEFRPTWFTAVPTMLQAALLKASEREEVIRQFPPRFLRSCSAALAPSILEKLESAFQAPVVEAYGMTEASHQMSSNPLPPRLRKPGSVGLPAGIEICVLDEVGTPLSPDELGEIAVRGKSVMAGYENNPQANAESFHRGWFKTGDQGYIDDEGYLFITGRLKEMINRGGEKISPREIDDVLLAHPAVSQAVAFAVPDDRLGEDVAAALVLRPGATATEEEIRSFAAKRLVHFKIPSRVIFPDEIPKGPTGKVQRIGLAAALGLAAGRKQDARPNCDRREPASEEEREVLASFEEVLAGRKPGPQDDFFLAGGDSMSAALVVARMEKKYAVKIPLVSFLLDPTAANLAAMIQGNETASLTSLVPIKPGGTLPPLFLAHPHDGHVFLCSKLAKYLDDDLPVFAFRASAGRLEPGPGHLEAMARQYVSQMTALQKEGPYFIGGYCFGAWIAFEMARQLAGLNRRVDYLALLDGYAPGFPLPRQNLSAAQRRACFLLDSLRRFRPFIGYAARLKRGQRISYLANLVRRQFQGSFIGFYPSRHKSQGSLFLPGREDDREWNYRPGPYEGPAELFCPSRQPLGFEEEPSLGWERFIRGPLTVLKVPGYHRSLIFEPRVRTLAAKLMAGLRKAMA